MAKTHSVNLSQAVLMPCVFLHTHSGGFHRYTENVDTEIESQDLATDRCCSLYRILLDCGRFVPQSNRIAIGMCRSDLQIATYVHVPHIFCKGNKSGIGVPSYRVRPVFVGAISKSPPVFVGAISESRLMFTFHISSVRATSRESEFPPTECDRYS